MGRRHHNAREKRLPGTADTRRISGHVRPDGSPKISYVSAGEARAVAEELATDGGAEVQVYRCRQCGAWHLASNR